MLWRVGTTDGGWIRLLVLLEFQSTIDRTMALRMTDYTVRILRSLNSSALGPGGEYPPILAILLYNGERRWNAATDIGDLFPPAPEELLAYLPRQRYLGADLRAFRFTELPLESSLGLMARFEQAESLERLAGLLAWLPEWGQR